MSGALQSLYTWKNCLIFHNSNVTLISPTSPAPSAKNIANFVFFHFQFQMQEHEGFHSWLIDMPTLENAIKSVHETSSSLKSYCHILLFQSFIHVDNCESNLGSTPVHSDGRGYGIRIVFAISRHTGTKSQESSRNWVLGSNIVFNHARIS